MKKYLGLLVSVFLFASHAQAVTTITGFGSSEYNPFSLDDFINGWTGTINPTDVSIANQPTSGGGGIYAVLPNAVNVGSISFTGATPAYLNLTGSLDQPTSTLNFTIQIFDSNGGTPDILDAEFTWDSFASGTTTVSAPLVFDDSSNSTTTFGPNITAYALATSGLSLAADDVYFTFDDLTVSQLAVPEPSTVAMLLLGLGLVGFGLKRRAARTDRVS
jgi:hypothetical protein